MPVTDFDAAVDFDAPIDFDGAEDAGPVAAALGSVARDPGRGSVAASTPRGSVARDPGRTSAPMSG